MTLHDRKLIAQAGKPRVPDRVFWRKQLLHRRMALEIQWRQVFPEHDFATLRLQSCRDDFLRSWNATCDRIGKEVTTRKDAKVLRIRRLLNEGISLERVWDELNGWRNRSMERR